MNEIAVYSRKTGYCINAGCFVYDLPQGVFFIDVELQRTGFGEKPLLVCPVCGSRRVKLYADRDHIGCRECMHINPYRGIQNTSQGTDARRLLYTMRKIADKAGYDLNLTTFDAYRVAQRDEGRPRYMHRRTFALMLAKLQILNGLRIRHIIAGRDRTLHACDISMIERATHSDFLNIRPYTELLKIYGI